MEIRVLRYFLTVAREGGINRVAKGGSWKLEGGGCTDPAKIS
ncbi:MAG: LysR family transcriptional regulator [Clostridiales bacterium]|nr:LysR family transcriptional regulator [Clostridiales bacterium]